METDERENQEDWAELYTDMMKEQLEILQKIDRAGLKEEAKYVADTWGLTTYHKEGK